MEPLLTPLKQDTEEIQDEDLEFLKVKNTQDLEVSQIPIPSPEFLKKISGQEIIKDGKKELTKHEKAYDAYCHWAALPISVRKPKTQLSFEKKWGLPYGYIAELRRREDFQNRRLQYFWEWMMDLLPNVVEAAYKRALKNSSVDARFFADLIAKRLDMEKPRVSVTPMVLVGVDQDKINNLFTPKGYENIQEITPQVT